MLGFTVEMLSPDQTRAVFPLVREAVPTLDLASWLRFARPLVNPRHAAHSGIVVARRDSRPFPCGLFCYRREDDLKLGSVLVAEHFVAVDILDPAPVLSVLAAELDALGKRLGCAAVRSIVHSGASEVAGGLAAAGHRPEASLLMCKELPPTARRAHRRRAPATTNSAS
jgi:hypothetical protein